MSMNHVTKAQLAQEVEILKAENDTRNTALKRQAKQIKELSAEVGPLMEANQVLQAENKRLKADIEDRKKDISDLTNRLRNVSGNLNNQYKKLFDVELSIRNKTAVIKELARMLTEAGK